MGHNSVVHLRGCPNAAPPKAQNFLNFMQFFGNFGHNHRLVSPPVGYPGSTNASGTYGICMAKLLSSFTVRKILLHFVTEFQCVSKA